MDGSAEKLLRWNNEDEAQVLRHVAVHGCSAWQTAAETLKCSSGLCAARWCSIVAAVRRDPDATGETNKRNVAAWSKAELAVVLGVYLHATASPDIKQAKAFIAAAASRVLPQRSAHAVHLVLNRVVLPNQAKLQVNFRASGLSLNIGELLDAWLHDPVAQMPDVEAKQLASQLLAAEGTASAPVAAAPQAPAPQPPPISQPPAPAAACEAAAEGSVAANSEPAVPITSCAAAAAAQALQERPDSAELAEPAVLQSGVQGMLETYHSSSMALLEEPDHAAAVRSAAAAAAGADTTASRGTISSQHICHAGRSKHSSMGKRRRDPALQNTRSSAVDQPQQVSELQTPHSVVKHADQCVTVVTTTAPATSGAAVGPTYNYHMQQFLQQPGGVSDSIPDWCLQIAGQEWPSDTAAATLAAAAAAGCTRMPQEHAASSPAAAAAAAGCKEYTEQVPWLGVNEQVLCDMQQLAFQLNQPQQLAAVHQVAPINGSLSAGNDVTPGAAGQQAAEVLHAAWQDGFSNGSGFTGVPGAGIAQSMQAGAHQQQLPPCTAAADDINILGLTLPQLTSGHSRGSPRKPDAQLLAAAHPLIQLKPQRVTSQLMCGPVPSTPEAQHQMTSSWAKGMQPTLSQLQMALPSFLQQQQQLQRCNSSIGSTLSGQAEATRFPYLELLRHVQCHQHPAAAAAAEGAEQPAAKRLQRLLTFNTHRSSSSAAAMAGGGAAVQCQQTQQLMQQWQWQQKQQQQQQHHVQVGEGFAGLAHTAAVAAAAATAAAVAGSDRLSVPAHVEDLQEIHQALNVMQHCIARIAATSRESRHAPQLQQQEQPQQQQKPISGVPDMLQAWMLPAASDFQPYTVGQHHFLQQQLQEWQQQLAAAATQAQQHQQSGWSTDSTLAAEAATAAASGAATAVCLSPLRHPQAADMAINYSSTCSRAAAGALAAGSKHATVTHDSAGLLSFIQHQECTKQVTAIDTLAAASYGDLDSVGQNHTTTQRVVTSQPKPLVTMEQQEWQQLQQEQQQLQRSHQMQRQASLPVASAMPDVGIAAVAGTPASFTAAGIVTNDMSASGAGTSAGSGSAQPDTHVAVADQDLALGTTTAAWEANLLQVNHLTRNFLLPAACSPTPRPVAISDAGGDQCVQGSTAAAAAALNDFALDAAGNDVWAQLSDILADAD